MSAAASAQTASAPLTIGEIKVEGNKNVAALVIHGNMVQKPGDAFSERRVRLDIRNLFMMGDFKDVKIEAQPGSKPSEVTLLVRVLEKPQVGLLNFKGNRKWGKEKFQESMKTLPKTPFDEGRLKADLQVLKKMYLEEGYPDVSLAFSAKEDPIKGLVDVTIMFDEGFQIKVGAVTVLGATAFSGQKVADQLKDNRDGNKYRPDLLAADLKRLEEFYQDEGFLKAAVIDHRIEPVEGKRKVTLHITVREGEKYVTGKVAVQGNVLFGEEELQKALGLKKGELLRRGLMEEGLRKVRTLYNDRGYIYSVVTPRMEYDDDGKKVDLSVEINEGQPSFVQDIKIVGNYKTQDYVIRRELDINPGDKFEASKIRLSAQALYNLGFFDEVNPEIEPGETAGKEVLVFRIKERKTGSISVGGGYSSVDGFVGNAKLEEANLFGKGQHASAQVEFGGKRTSFNLGFNEPWLFNTRTSLGVNLYNTTRDFIGSVSGSVSDKLYTDVLFGGSVSVGRRLSRQWSVFGAYSLQHVEIKDINPSLSDPASPNYIQPSSSLTSSFTPRLVFDSRDNYFDPTSGWRHQFSLQLAGGPFFGQNNFVKLIQDSSVFIPLPLGVTFGQHARLGVAQGFSFGGKYTPVPVNERFYAGGSDTVRGYNERTVGPPVGGNALFISNTELKRPIAGPLRGVLFFDMGGAWADAQTMITGDQRVQFGAGVGLRLTIPGTMMALRLDYGWPLWSDLSPNVLEKGGVLHFNLGDLF
jgi:outer membrane protein insertion porin family